MNSKLPTVSFVTCTFNSQATIKECMESVKTQDYPQDKIEVIVVDGGSKDKTLEIARSYSFCKIKIIPTDGPEEATAIGYNMSSSDYVVNYPSDNVLPDKNWLKRMVKPLEENKDIVASETTRYTYNSKDKPLNKYFALFGMNDPVAFYLNKRDRGAYFEEGWYLSAPAEDKGDYYLATFTKDNLPTVGANGFVVRTKIIQKATKDPKKFSHIDTCVDLLEMGYNHIAFVKTSIWHKTGEELGNFFKKRRKYAMNLYFKKQSMRRYHLYNPKTDTLKLILFILYSLTLIEPVLQSLRGYLKIRDTAWFLHPVICFVITLNYVYTVMSFKLNLWKNTIKENTA